MPIVPKQFTVRLVMETRALNVRGEVQVFAVSGKGHDSGWSRVREGLEALGFRVQSEGDSHGK